MTRKQMEKALVKHQHAQRMERFEKRFLSMDAPDGYPATHNPYIPHIPMTDCWSGCVHTKATIEAIPAGDQDRAVQS